MRRQIQAIKENGLVLREKLKVVGLYHQIVLANLRVGRISVLNVDRAFAKRFVAESMIDADHVLPGEPIGFAQRLPTVAAVEKLVGQTEF